VLAGSSAGGICWFEGGTTDSFGRDLREFQGGLALLPGSFCPHYNSEDQRRPLYHKLVGEGSLPDGIACDDGVGAHYIDDSLAEIVSDRPSGNAYRVLRDPAGGTAETLIPTRYLGA
jgi:peptidase E